MAKKPQRLSQSLGRLRALEQDVAVVSNPVDTFTRAAPITESTRAREIEKGLARLSPVIAGLVADRRVQQQEEDIQEGFTRYKNASDEEKEENLKLIKETDPTKSEYWMEGYLRAHVNSRANAFATPFSVAFAEAKDAPDFNYETFADQFTQQYVMENRLDVFDDDILIDNFFGRIEGVVNQRRQNHNEQEAAKVITQRSNLYTGELDTIVADSQRLDPATGSVLLDINALTTGINAFVTETIDRDASTAVIAASVQHLETLAKRFAADGSDEWREMLQGMSSIPLKVGTYGATSEGAAKIQQLAQQLEKTARDSEIQDMRDHEARMKYQADDIEDSMIQAVAENPKFGEAFQDLNSSITFMHNGEEMTIKDAFTFIAKHNPQRHQQLQIYGINSQIENRVTDPQVFNDIVEMVNQLPEDKLVEMINNNSHNLSAADELRLLDYSKDSKVLAAVEAEVNPNGFTVKAEFQELFRDKIYGGYQDNYQRKVGRMMGLYTEAFDRFRAGLGEVNGKLIGKVDLNTPEGKAQYKAWKDSTIEKIKNDYLDNKEITELAQAASEENRPKILEDTSVTKVRGMINNWVQERTRIERGGAGDLANTDFVKFLQKYRQTYEERTGKPIDLKVALAMLKKELEDKE